MSASIPMSTGPVYRAGAAAGSPHGLPESMAGSIGGGQSTPAAVPPSATAAGETPARLVGVNRDGTDGSAFTVVGDRFDIGRRSGAVTFEGDGYLNERHVRIERRDGRFHLVDLDSLNGVYLRIRQREELCTGNTLLVGMEVLRFELLSQQEREPTPAVEHGVLVFGTPPRRPWGRLRQVTTAGTSRDIYHLYRSEVVIGRESGDIVFSDDEFMSRMHAAVRNEAGRAWLVDMGSSNGTFIRVERERQLQSGDVIRLGDQLLRFEER